MDFTPPFPSETEKLAVFKQCQEAYHPKHRRISTLKFLLSKWVNPQPHSTNVIEYSEEHRNRIYRNFIYHGPRNKTPTTVPDNCHKYILTPLTGRLGFKHRLQLTDPIGIGYSLGRIAIDPELISILYTSGGKEVIWCGYIPFAPRRFINNLVTEWLSTPIEASKRPKLN